MNRGAARFFSDHIEITFVTPDGEEVLVSTAFLNG